MPAPYNRLTLLAAGVAAAVVFAVPFQPSAAAAEIAPHRAIYKLELASVRSGSSVSDVDGQMMFQWGDACDGWTIEQRYHMNFLYAGGNEARLNSVYATWESKDGRDFNFNMRTATDGSVDEELRGVASLTPAGSGTASFRLPERAEEPLPAGTLFPTAHSIALLAQAEAGSRFFTATLFDGTKLDGLVLLSAVIGEGRPAAAAGDARDPLLAGPSWPVRLAFFENGEENEEPEYEMSIRIYDNGVVDAMLIDYGDFAVRAVLEQIDALGRPDC